MNRTPFYEQVRDRLIRYARVDTQSARTSDTVPTTKKQFDLAYMLRDELNEIGAADVWLDEEKCVLYASIPATVSGAMAFGLVTHMDTAPDAPGAGCRPWVLENYDGGDILLNGEKGIVMTPKEFPNLKNYVGQDLILTDGTTLLGGDDKASIAAIMTLAEYYARHPEAKHGTVCLAFTPDEEVGGLAQDLDLDRFGAPYAYTLDGDHLGWYQDQTFHAIAAKVTITGRSVHPATAKGIMVNACDIAGELLTGLPKQEKPQYTCGTEGFFYVVSVQADCEHAEIHIILRDFDRRRIEARQALLRELARKLEAEYGEGRVRVEFEEQYRNMGEVISQYPFLVDNLRTAIRAAGLEPKSEPFRGGTDGSALSFRGLPAPNLSAGYENAHGRFEFVPVPSMAKNVEILIRLCEIYAGLA